MNEPFKLKLHSLRGLLYERKRYYTAFKHVKENGGSAGIDKVSIAEFEAHIDEYIDEIIASLRNDEYKPSPVRRVYIPKKNGKLRPLGVPTIKDRVLQQVLTDALTRTCEEKIFHNDSCGFRPNRSAETVLTKIMWRIEQGYDWMYDYDIKGCFDNVNHKKLMKILNKYISDSFVLNLIWKWLKAGYLYDEIRYDTPSGIIQGGVISPLLINLYLNEVDWELEKANIAFVRYADDALLFAHSKEELEIGIEIVQRMIQELGMEIEETKTKIVDFHKDDFKFLGFQFMHLRQRKVDNSEYYIIGP